METHPQTVSLIKLQTDSLHLKLKLNDEPLCSRTHHADAQPLSAGFGERAVRRCPQWEKGEICVRGRTWPAKWTNGAVGDRVRPPSSSVLLSADHGCSVLLTAAQCYSQLAAQCCSELLSVAHSYLLNAAQSCSELLSIL